jgi:hypothetical protein
MEAREDGAALRPHSVLLLGIREVFIASETMCVLPRRQDKIPQARMTYFRLEQTGALGTPGEKAGRIG